MVTSRRRRSCGTAEVHVISQFSQRAEEHPSAPLRCRINKEKKLCPRTLRIAITCLGLLAATTPVLSQTKQGQLQPKEEREIHGYDNSTQNVIGGFKREHKITHQIWRSERHKHRHTHGHYAAY
jgi:hypothetical protein